MFSSPGTTSRLCMAFNFFCHRRSRISLHNLFDHSGTSPPGLSFLKPFAFRLFNTYFGATKNFGGMWPGIQMQSRIWVSVDDIGSKHATVSLSSMRISPLAVNRNAVTARLCGKMGSHITITVPLDSTAAQQNLAAVNYSIFHFLHFHRRVQSIKLKVQQEATIRSGCFPGLNEK